MNVIDLCILALLLVGLMIGYRRGFILQVVHLVSFIIAFTIAFQFFGELTPYLQSYIPSPFDRQHSSSSLLTTVFDMEGMFYAALSFAILFFGTRIVLHLVGHLLSLIASLPGLNLANRWLGGALGLLEAFLVIFIFIHILLYMPWEQGREWIEESKIATVMMDHSLYWSDQIQEVWRERSGIIDGSKEKNSTYF